MSLYLEEMSLYLEEQLLRLRDRLEGLEDRVRLLEDQMTSAMSVVAEARRLVESGYDGPFMGEEVEPLFKAVRGAARGVQKLRKE